MLTPTTTTKKIIWHSLRANVCKDRESPVSEGLVKLLIFGQEIPLGEPSSKSIFKSSSAFLILRNPPKFIREVKVRISGCKTTAIKA